MCDVLFVRYVTHLDLTILEVRVYRWAHVYKAPIHHLCSSWISWRTIKCSLYI